MLRDGAGMANPFLFSESVANAPAGYSAIEMDTRAASITFTCGDASAAAAVAFAARAIRTGRLDLAYCGGVEMFSLPLLRALATMGSPSFIGEGPALLLESMDAARSCAERASTPSWPPMRARRTLVAGATDWTRDLALRRRDAPGGAHGRRRAARSLPHACGSTAADDAERRAAKEVFPRAPIHEISSITGA